METLLSKLNNLYEPFADSELTEEGLRIRYSRISYFKISGIMELHISTRDKTFPKPEKEHNLSEEESIPAEIIVSNFRGCNFLDYETRISKEEFYSWLCKVDQEATSGERIATFYLKAGPFAYWFHTPGTDQEKLHDYIDYFVCNPRFVGFPKTDEPNRDVQASNYKLSEFYIGIIKILNTLYSRFKKT